MPEGMDEMKGLESHLLKGAVTLAGFLVVLAAVDNLKNTADDIGKRKLEEAKASQEAQAREEASKREREINALTQQLWEENQKTPIYPAAQAAPHPSETVPLSDAEMTQLNDALANQKSEREKSASNAR